MYFQEIVLEVMLSQQDLGMARSLPDVQCFRVICGCCKSVRLFCLEMINVLYSSACLQSEFL